MNKQTDRKKIIVSNSSADSETVSDFLREYIHSQNISEDILADLRLATEEIFINIVSYAYPPEKKPEEEQKVTLELSHSSSSIDVTFTDTGRAFNPLTDCTPSIESDDHCDGGMGIPLIKSLTDRQEYNRIKNRNVFTVTKHYTNQN